MLRETAVPSQSKYPVGALAVGHITIEPETEGVGIAAILEFSKAVVASWVVFVPVVAVGAVGPTAKVAALETLKVLALKVPTSVSLPVTVKLPLIVKSPEEPVWAEYVFVPSV